MMYWNGIRKSNTLTPHLLNRHIWCIETWSNMSLLSAKISWTDTYDVLKLNFYLIFKRKFDSWTDTYDVLKRIITQINIPKTMAWTDTYDVLKHRRHYLPFPKISTWTDTYDVLKLSGIKGSGGGSNLEPTHMMYWNYLPFKRDIRATAWTDTYDVLKHIS